MTIVRRLAGSTSNLPRLSRTNNNGRTHQREYAYFNLKEKEKMIENVKSKEVVLTFEEVNQITEWLMCYSNYLRNVFSDHASMTSNLCRALSEDRAKIEKFIHSMRPSYWGLR